MGREKEAVAFLLDTSPSMNEPYPSSESNNSNQPKGTSNKTMSTRLSCAKQAIEDMLCNLMLSSKLNEAMVLLLNTKETRHHLCCDEQVEDGTAMYPHITELSPTDINGFDKSAVAVKMAKPTVELLRALRNVKSVSSGDRNASIGGDFLDGLIVASDAIYQRTEKRKFKRRIVLYTDAAYETQFLDRQQELNIVISGLRALDCCIEVIGLDFSQSAEFKTPMTIKSEDFNDNDSKKVEQSVNISAREVENEDEYKAIVKQENEKLLIGIAKLTGGFVAAASTIQQVNASTLGKRIPVSMSTKCIFKVAPSIEVNARFALFAKVEQNPTFKSEAIKIDHEGNIKKDPYGNEMTSKISTAITYQDPENKNVEIGKHQRVKAFRYGSTIVPIGEYDIESLKIRSPVSLSILGYTARDSIPRSACVGPTYVVYGEGSSARARTIVAILVQSLRDLNQVALCRFVKKKDNDPILGMLFPSSEVGNQIMNQNYLFLMKLPFAEDVQKLILPSLSIKEVTRNQRDAADNLVDSLMLPPDTTPYWQIPNPCIRGINKTIMNRAIDPTSMEIECPRQVGTSQDSIATPPEILDSAMEAIENYLRLFPLQKNNENVDSKSKKQRVFWAEENDGN